MKDNIYETNDEFRIEIEKIWPTVKGWDTIGCCPDDIDISFHFIDAKNNSRIVKTDTWVIDLLDFIKKICKVEHYEREIGLGTWLIGERSIRSIKLIFLLKNDISYLVNLSFDTLFEAIEEFISNLIESIDSIDTTNEKKGKDRFLAVWEDTKNNYYNYKSKKENQLNNK